MRLTRLFSSDYSLLFYYAWLALVSAFLAPHKLLLETGMFGQMKSLLLMKCMARLFTAINLEYLHTEAVANARYYGLAGLPMIKVFMSL